VSTYEQRDNSGSLFKNDRREKDSQPNARGKAMIDGVMYEVSAWTKQGQKGPWQSLSFKRLDNDQRRTEPPRQASRFGGDEFMDDVPF
jgi:hypothetical protein